MRKLFLTVAGAFALFLGVTNFMSSEAQAQPHGWGHPPPRHMAPPPHHWRGPSYRPRCVTRSSRVWNGRRWIWREERICR